jgi:hypothetical protein
MSKKKTTARSGRIKKTDARDALVDLTPDEIKKLVKPRPGFENFLSALLSLYRSEPELQIKGLNLALIEAAFSSFVALQPLEASASKHLEMVQETRLLHSSNAWSGMLKIYNRAQSVAKTNQAVARGIADFAKFMKTGPYKKKSPAPAPAAPAA